MARESVLCAMRAEFYIGLRRFTARSIVFPPIILSKLIYDRLFGRWTVGEASCACVRERADTPGADVAKEPLKKLPLIPG